MSASGVPTFNLCGCLTSPEAWQFLYRALFIHGLKVGEDRSPWPWCLRKLFHTHSILGPEWTPDLKLAQQDNPSFQGPSKGRVV